MAEVILSCSVSGCERPARKRGWCATHYDRWRRLGSLELPPKPPMAERFWAKVDRLPGADACWEWTAAKQNKGYGYFGVHGRVDIRTAHRVAWELTIGPIPAGMWVLHHCDNRACVRPSHLFLGTAKDNTADMMQKDRGTPPPRNDTQGTRNPMAKLTEADVREIRRLLAVGGLSHRQISRLFHVTAAAVSQISRKHTWGWLK